MSSESVVNFLHLLATAVWIGGMFFIKLVLMPGLAAIEPAQRGRMMGVIAKRFTMVVWSCVAVLLVTGLLKTPSAYLLDAGTRYGTLLLLKHAAFAVMILAGLLITFVAAPKLRAAAPAPGAPPSPEYVAAQKRLDALSALNTVLGVGVLLLVAFM